MSGSKEEHGITVLITGFGPFPRADGSSHLQNSSHEISKLLPPTLPPLSPFNPTPYPIHLLNPTSGPNSALPVSYSHIRSYISSLHDNLTQSTSANPQPDLLLHIGMAETWDFVSVERRGYKQGFTSSWGGGGNRGKGLCRYYRIKDARGETVEDAGECPWGEDVPWGLATNLNVDDVIDGARGLLGVQGGRRVEAHEDPGTYCCGFIYYESLANKFTKQTPAEILFCHVPGDLDTPSLQNGANSILAIIGSAATQLLGQRSMSAGGSGAGGVGVPVSASAAVEPMAVAAPVPVVVDGSGAVVGVGFSG